MAIESAPKLQKLQQRLQKEGGGGSRERARAGSSRLLYSRVCRTRRVGVHPRECVSASRRVAPARLLTVLVQVLRARQLGGRARGAPLCDPPSSSHAATQSVLLLIAHPDDEAMFFVPALVAAAGEHTVHVMSMSNGDYDGLGKTREYELRKSCALLGIPADRITIVDDPGLQDGPQNIWDASPIAFYLMPYIKRHNLSAIITFDARGVSGHPNHIALYAALCHLSRPDNCLIPGHVRLWALESVGLPRKFMGPVAVLEHDVLRMLRLSAPAVEHVVSSLDVALVCRCLHAHRSQAVWYRWLFVYFSRYTFFNRLVPLH